MKVVLMRRDVIFLFFSAQGNSQLAIQFFESAVHHGSPFEAFYYLGIIQYAIAVSGKAGEGACASAVSFFKTVAERGTWGENNLMRRAENAWTSGSTDSEDEGGGGGEQAMLLWSIAGEQGYEAAQNNLAYILDADTSLLARFRPSLAVAGQPEQPKQPTEDTSAAALAQWTRVSAQSNVDALVKVGDYYYRGLGLPDMPEGTRWEKAAGFYRAAADTHMSALAMWNLGWMYENGRGVPRDFHLAKRYYDLALETNGEAYLPVMLSLLKLYARSVWHTINGGTDGLRLWPLDDEEDGMSSYVVGGIILTRSAELATPAHEHKKIDGAEEKQSKDRKEEDASETEDDGPWYPGKARELFDKRRGAPVDDSDDAVEVS
jgi:SEL1 protein